MCQLLLLSFKNNRKYLLTTRPYCINFSLYDTFKGSGLFLKVLSGWAAALYFRNTERRPFFILIDRRKFMDNPDGAKIFVLILVGIFFSLGIAYFIHTSILERKARKKDNERS